MNSPLKRGRYQSRRVTTTEDLRACQALRAKCFGRGVKWDQDPFDATCTHTMIEDLTKCTLIGCYRTQVLTARTLTHGYSAQHYDLSAMATSQGRMLELGRFCIDPDHRDPDILRLAWAGITAQVDAEDVQMIFGCSTFKGVDPAPYLEAFAMLRADHLAPVQWRPTIKAADVFPYAAVVRHTPDMKRALKTMPPLLRSYLLIGGWVSDHAVIDPVLNTLHVFTGVEIASIPPARQRLLRAMI